MQTGELALDAANPQENGSFAAPPAPGSDILAHGVAQVSGEAAAVCQPDLDGALAEALRAAATAGNLTLVTEIVALLKARRDERAGVTSLDVERTKRETGR